MYKIMIVEDDKELSKIIDSEVSKWGYEPYQVKDFSSIKKEFIEVSPDMVLLDINLPLYDGYYWCREIRSVSKVPILFISSRDSDYEQIMAMNMGGDDFIAKPFTLEFMIAKVQAILRRAYNYKEYSEHLMFMRGLSFNINDFTIINGDKKIELSKNEGKILKILLKNRGKIIDRDYLMKSLWDDEAFISDNTLTVNINRLRSKLEENGIENLIETKKGKGYLINEDC